MEADRHRERLEDAAFLALKMDGENKVKKKKKDGWWGHEPRNAGGLWKP